MRRRITILAALIVAAVLAVVGLAVVWVVHRELYGNLDRSLAQRAADVGARTGADPVIVVSDPEDHFAQVFDADGRVIAASPNAAHLDVGWPQPATGTRTLTAGSLPIDDGAYRVLVRAVGSGSERRYTVVGQSTDDLRDTVRALVVTLAILFPLALLALALAVWWLVGRTLRPVDAIRAEVDSIGLQALDRRVPVPGTGDEVDRLAATMNEMLDRLEVASAQQRRFVADASHELRTPLTRMRTQLDVELRSGAGEHQQTLLSVRDDAIDMQTLVEDLLFLARRDAVRVPAGRRAAHPLDLDVVVLDEVHAVRRESTVELDASAVDAVEVRGSDADLRRLVRNLLANAVRYAESRVEVAVRAEQSTAVVTVADDGPGIPAGDRARVFGRFVRLDESRSARSGGSGLGLAIVQEIAEAHRGTVRIDDTAMGGTCVVVALPLVDV
ncbi:MAG: HAMP domain-containing sensor histidine kinase [Acidimicrobiales bacterium]